MHTCSKKNCVRWSWAQNILCQLVVVCFSRHCYGTAIAYTNGNRRRKKRRNRWVQFSFLRYNNNYNTAILRIRVFTCRHFLYLFSMLILPDMQNQRSSMHQIEMTQVLQNSKIDCNKYAEIGHLLLSKAITTYKKLPFVCNVYYKHICFI